MPTSTTYVTSQAIRHTSIASSFVTSTSTSRTTFTAKLPLQCPPQVPRSRNLKEFSNHCYEFILGIHEKWPEAELDCNHRGGHLVSIGSSSEQNFIYRTLRVGIKQRFRYQMTKQMTNRHVHHSCTLWNKWAGFKCTHVFYTIYCFIAALESVQIYMFHGYISNNITYLYLDHLTILTLL